jgi:hypothetical protein
MKDVEKLYQSIPSAEERYLEEACQVRTTEKNRSHLMLAAACLATAVALCGFGYATYWGVGATDEIPFHALTQNFQTTTSDTEEGTNYTELEKSDLITDYSNVLADNSVNCPTENGEIPSIYFSPTYMVIFTQAENSGWTLNAGEKLDFSLDLNKSQSLSLEFGYVLDGQYHAFTSVMGSFGETFQAPEAGEYYFCVTNCSSSNAVVDGGRIVP